MAKTSSIQKNNRRRRLVAQKADKRKRLKEIANDLKLPAKNASPPALSLPRCRETLHLRALGIVAR